MKLYLWEDHYQMSSGGRCVVVAIANTEEEAREIANRKLKKENDFLIEPSQFATSIHKLPCAHHFIWSKS